MPDRPWLHTRIEQRLEIMWNDGLVTEVIDLLDHYPLTPNSTIYALRWLSASTRIPSTYRSPSI